jgi:hypothetical protein
MTKKIKKEKRKATNEVKDLATEIVKGVKEIMPEEITNKKIEMDMFQQWLSMSRKQRKARNLPASIESFANRYNIRRTKLFEWKNDENFLNQVAIYRKRFILDEMPEVIDSVIEKAKKTGSESAAKFLAEYAGDYKQVNDISIGGELADLFIELQKDKK